MSAGGGFRAVVLVTALLLTASCTTPRESADSPGAEPSSPGTPGETSSPGPSSPEPTDAVTADLVITLDETGEGTPRTFLLTCGPAGGDHPDPEAACAALAAAGGADAMTPPARDEVCTEVYGGPAVATVQGTIDGTEVNAAFGRSNGCEIRRWDALAALLGSTGGGA